MIREKRGKKGVTLLGQVSERRVGGMIRVLPILVAVLMRGGVTMGSDEIKLETNAIIRFEFPELPKTLMGMATGEKKPALLTMQLPENYSTNAEIGLLVHLDGGRGGWGDRLGEGRSITGGRDFVCVNLPLFKRALDKKEIHDGLLIGTDDFEVISRAYRVMLKKVFDTIPNIKQERCVMGGFSNGAHTTGVLMAGQDEFILSHFRTFYLVEGGVGPLAGNVLHKAPMKRCRFLLLNGDQVKDKSRDEPSRQFASGVVLVAQKHNLDLTSIAMRGYGHELPAPYMKLVGNWIRGEKLPEVEPKPVSAP